MRKELRPYQEDVVSCAIKAMTSSPEPVLLSCPTGAGKTLINSFLAEFGESMGVNVLCLSSFSELIDQNSEEHIEQGNSNSVFCASLSSKKYRNKTVMGTPQSVWSAIKSGHPIKDKVFGLILIDEVHRVNPDDDNTVYMKILNHYLSLMPQLRLCGFTGTPFRGGMEPIYGEGKMFPKLNYSIKFGDLVKMGYLNPPVFGLHDNKKDFDYSQVKQNKQGNFDQAGLKAVVGDNQKTTKIMVEVVEKTLDSYGVFIFCSTIEQCHHVMRMLPEKEARLITGDMNEKDRMKAMKEAKEMKVKYLVNVNVLTTGINIPHFDTVVYLRLTESGVFFVQSIGRGSRLSPETNKTHFTVLDYAGNCEKFRDINDETLAAAVLKIDDESKGDAKLDVACPKCATMNTVHDRRCRGFDHNQSRCDYMFVFRECPICRNQCDVSARTCPHCDHLLHDYNKGLKLKAYQDKKTVFDVQGFHAVKHFNFKAKRDIVKMVYLTTCDETICSYFDPNGSTWQKKQWKDFLVTQGMPEDYEAPNHIPTIMTVTQANFMKPKVIEAIKDGAYHKIVNIIY